MKTFMMTTNGHDHRPINDILNSLIEIYLWSRVGMEDIMPFPMIWVGWNKKEKDKEKWNQIAFEHVRWTQAPHIHYHYDHFQWFGVALICFVLIDMA